MASPFDQAVDQGGRPAPAHLARAALILATLLLASCVPLVQYHTEPPSPDACRPDRENCAAAYIEDHPEYLLGFVEFDDLGWSWDRRQQQRLLDRLEQETRDQDVLMVVFAHGWKHNAQTCDTNVSCFRDTLSQLHATEVALAGKGKPRRIVGIYIGWRGASSDNKLLKQTTFYGRKGTAHKVGSGAVTELLVRLKYIRTARHRMLERETPPRKSSTRLVIVGHSFGGALVFSATSQLIMERIALAEASGDRLVHGFGDLVVLVNPAFEAARFQPLHAIVKGQEYDATQRPVLAIITSEADQATGRAFPLGRWFPAKFDDYRKDGLHTEQKRANRDAVGHFPPYRTHWLTANANTPTPVQPDPALAADCGCPYGLLSGPTIADEAMTGTLDRLRTHDWQANAELEFPTSTLSWEKGDLAYNAPVMVVSTDGQIIMSHSDIYQTAFVDFLRYLIMLAGDPVEYGG